MCYLIHQHELEVELLKIVHEGRRLFLAMRPQASADKSDSTQRPMRELFYCWLTLRPKKFSDSPTSINYFILEKIDSSLRLSTIFFSGGHVVLHMRIHSDNMAGISDGIDLRKYSGPKKRII